jgi:hypothetical protein
MLNPAHHQIENPVDICDQLKVNYDQECIPIDHLPSAKHGEDIMLVDTVCQTELEKVEAHRAFFDISKVVQVRFKHWNLNWNLSDVSLTFYSTCHHYS